MKREQSFSRTVSFKAGNIEIITGFMNKTRKNFSATLNIILEQWDEFSAMMERAKCEQDANREVDQIKHAEILHTDLKKTDVKRIKKK